MVDQYGPGDFEERLRRLEAAVFGKKEVFENSEMRVYHPDGTLMDRYNLQSPPLPNAGPPPIPMVLHCPECRTRHIDEGEFATKHHHTHSCQGCGLTWRPAVVPTVRVRFLPGFKSAP